MAQMDAIQGELEFGKQHHFGLNQFHRKQNNKKIQCLLRSDDRNVGRLLRCLGRKIGKEMEKGDPK